MPRPCSQIRLNSGRTDKNTHRFFFLKTFFTHNTAHVLEEFVHSAVKLVACGRRCPGYAHRGSPAAADSQLALTQAPLPAAENVPRKMARVKL